MRRGQGPAPRLRSPVDTQIRPPTTASFAFRVLGPLSIAIGTNAAVLQPAKPTVLLATLLLHPNEVVSTQVLQRAIWGDEPPLAAKAALQTCALRLRQLFARHGIAETAIETVPGGYRSVVDGKTLDLVRFRELAAEARTEADLELELYVLEEALAYWQGPLLANVPSDLLQRDVVPRITEERLRVIERVSDIKIELGRARSALLGLWEAARTYPTHERIAEQLIEVLYHTGRQAEALSEFRRIRDYLNDELGVDPGPALRRLELAILRGERFEDKTEQTPARSQPRQEPAVQGAPGFVGRGPVSQIIAGRLRADPVLIVLTGPFGIGKTALARHVAALTAGDFPGGQYLVAMRNPDGEPRAVEEIVAQVCGPEPATGRRLLVLDDVVGVDQALPALTRLGTGAALLLTSRRSLAGVVARHGGWLHRLDTFDPDESLQLLTSVLGAERVGAEPAALRQLAELCDHLPLALRIIGTRLLTRPRMSIADAVEWLHTERVTRLSLPGDADLSLVSRFSDALGQLHHGLASSFLRLGSARSPRFSVAACAQLLHTAPDAAEDLLEQLVDASLVEEGPQHYWIRDLLRRCARGLADPDLAAPPDTDTDDPKGTPR
jgi:DNA-binding SARP family transcriptional activator